MRTFTLISPSNVEFKYSESYFEQGLSGTTGEVDGFVLRAATERASQSDSEMVRQWSFQAKLF